MANEMPSVVPMISYEDGIAALEWLTKAFGFVERTRYIGEDGRLGHGEMDAGTGVIMLATPSPEYQSPKRHRETCNGAKAWSAVPWVVDGVLVYVDDIDQHYEQAKAAGASILSEPEGQPYGRLYRAEDLEGHRWMFLQREADQQG
jgi:uncharacterized glyoxalase superfamily protein PhnB